MMQFPKKFSVPYKEGETPFDVIIRGCGELPTVKIVEYVIKKAIGTMYVYKIRG